ncbi:MAG: A/G-specific adenine glycosylase [Candidatus Eremiobacteraeota bacterium]|nr:A/G-specific adenine glycosylase [Candidatus Eremiobacteraeota bacterium]
MVPRDIATPLLAWFDRHGRAALPWRSNRAPYRIVVSEFMLQQTQVDRVVPIFERFVAVWPTFEALAAASQADVVRAWRGLGYNSRAVRLHRLARAVRDAHGGALPAAEQTLRQLPGIGPYTARAVAAFAFDADVAAVDTNVRRIVHRTQLGVEWPPRAGERKLDAIAASLVPRGAGFAFNSALMDLGATICTARAPKCLLCPLVSACAAAPIDGPTLAALASNHAKSRSSQERLRFEETTRYARGRIIDRLRSLTGGERISLLDLQRELAPLLAHHDAAAITRVVARLAREGVLDERDGDIALA